MDKDSKTIINAIQDHLRTCTGEGCTVELTQLCVLALEQQEEENDGIKKIKTKFGTV